MYDHSVELKNQRRAKEEQEQLAFDMKILEQVLEESRNEAKEMSTRKVCPRIDNSLTKSSISLTISEKISDNEILFLSLQQELREEDRRYREYLQQLKEIEALRERELERLCDIEVQKTWDKKLNQWRLEKQARQKLLQDVLESRRKQIEEKCELVVKKCRLSLCQQVPTSPVDFGRQGCYCN